jgi:hypothetical protein
MKKILFIFLVSSLIFACTKNNDIIPNPDPDPDPPVYKTEITVTFIVPDDVTMYGGDAMWVLRSDKEQITNRIQMTFPVKTIVLTGDSIRDNLNKTAYLKASFSKEIGSIHYAYYILKSFIMKPEVELTFIVSSEREDEYYIDP